MQVVLNAEVSDFDPDSLQGVSGSPPEGSRMGSAASSQRERHFIGLKGQPVLHMFWIECSVSRATAYVSTYPFSPLTSLKDLDSYKAFARDEITSWLSRLGDCGITEEWCVVLVEASDSKKTNKLLPTRTSVLDRLKADVGGRQPERCLSLLGMHG